MTVPLGLFSVTSAFILHTQPWSNLAFLTSPLRGLRKLNVVFVWGVSVGSNGQRSGFTSLSEAVLSDT